MEETSTAFQMCIPGCKRVVRGSGVLRFGQTRYGIPPEPCTRADHGNACELSTYPETRLAGFRDERFTVSVTLNGSYT